MPDQAMICTGIHPMSDVYVASRTGDTPRTQDVRGTIVVALTATAALLGALGRPGPA
jgi:hypothetical protein